MVMQGREDVQMERGAWAAVREHVLLVLEWFVWRIFKEKGPKFATSMTHVVLDGV